MVAYGQSVVVLGQSMYSPSMVVIWAVLWTVDGRSTVVPWTVHGGPWWVHGGLMEVT